MGCRNLIGRGGEPRGSLLATRNCWSASCVCVESSGRRRIDLDAVLVLLSLVYLLLAMFSSCCRAANSGFQEGLGGGP
jgi:hypothetical protein